MVKGKTILKWVCLGLLMAYTVWIVAWAHAEASRHVCRAIEVEVDAQPPLDTITRNGVYDVLKDYPVRIIGVPIDQVDTRRIEKHLDALSNFEDVNCMVSGSGTLHVSVTPMVPVMRVFVGDKSYYINKDGKHIASNAEFYNDVPVVSGNFTHGFQPRDVLPLIRFIQNDPMMRDLTSMVVANDARNLIVVPKVTGHVVNFGDTTRLAQKRDALRLFYRKVMPHKGWDCYDTISVKFHGQVVATRRDKTRLNIPEDFIEEVDPEEATLPTPASVTETTPENTAKPDE